MRKFFGLLTLCAVAFVGCNEKPEPEPVQPKPTLEVVSANPMEFSADGGECIIKYELTNPKEGVNVVATTEAEWIVEFDSLEARQNEIALYVNANENEEPRSATVTLSYDELSVDVVVNQAAKPEPTAPVLATIDLQVENITWNNADIVVTPSQDVEYILGIMTKANFAEYAEDVETIVAARIATWEKTAKNYEENYGYNDPWQYYMKIEQRSGERSYNVKYDDLYKLDWDSEYVVYCFGMNDEGEQTASVAVKEFRTEAPTTSDNSFVFTIDEMTQSSVAFTIEPTTDEQYYVTIESMDILSQYGPDKDKSYDDMIKYLMPDSDYLLEKRLFTGKQSLSNEDLGNSVNGMKSYRVVAWGFNNGPTTEVFMSEEFTPADPTVDFDVAISIDEVTHNSVAYSVVPTVLDFTYYHALCSADVIGEDGGLAYAESLIAAGVDTRQLRAGFSSNEVEVEPETDYRVIVFGYAASTNSISSEIFLSEVITTEPEPEGDAAIKIEISNIAWNGADIQITPTLPFQYYYGCYTKADYEAKFTQPSDFIDTTIEKWKKEAQMYYEPWTTTMKYHTTKGSTLADVGTLRWSTDYIFICFGIDDDGTLLTDAITAEFTTLTPVASDNEFTITINSMTSSSVEFTVTPTLDDQYYVTVEQVGITDQYGPGKDKSYDDMIDYLLPDYDSQLNKRLFSGEQTITNTDLGNTVSSNKEYRIVVWGFDNGPTTTVFMSEPFNPAD